MTDGARLGDDLGFFDAEQAILLHDGDYPTYVLTHVRRARQCVCVAQFIVDVFPLHDRHRHVLTVCHALGRAAWRGVDVRVLLNPFETRDGIDGNLLAGRWLARRGVDVRSFRAAPGARRRLSHSKLVLFDRRLAVVGSHNFTNGAFNGNHETSLAVASPDVARRLQVSFDEMWDSSAAVNPS